MHSYTHFRTCHIHFGVHLIFTFGPHYLSCDGVRPSRLSPRSDLTLSLNHVMVRDSLGSVQGPTSFFSNHVMVCDPLGSVQGPTSPFFKSCDGV